MRCLILSQCKDLRAGLIWEDFGARRFIPVVHKHVPVLKEGTGIIIAIVWQQL